MLGPNIPANFSFQTTDPTTNQVTGTPNTRVDIAAGQLQTYVISLTPTAPFAPTEVAFTLSGTKTVPLSTLTGLNTLLLSASSGPVPDIMALAATTPHDVIVNISNVSSTGALPSPP